MTHIYKRNVALQKRLDEIKERKETVMSLGPNSHVPPQTFVRVESGSNSFGRNKSKNKRSISPDK